MDSRCLRSFVVVAGLLAIASATGCGGGGGGSGSGGGGGGFILADVKYGRVVDDGTGPRLVSPLTTATIDPITGLLVPGSLQPLAPGVDVNAVQTLGIGTDYLPRVVPRNCVIQLDFNGPIDPASVSADVADANGNVVTPGSVQLRTQSNQVIPVTVTLHGPRTIWVNPFVGGGVGFPPSPIDFGPSGDPRADATGFLKLRLPRVGSAIVRSSSGKFLAQRADKLGDALTPIGINPGNAVLDFIAQNQLIPTNESFNGFLPDIRPPRIVRTYRYSHTLSLAGGDSATSNSITEPTAAFSTAARGGLGEWAGARVTVRPGAGNQEIRPIAGNSRTTITIVGTFTLPPQDGDAYLLERSELFEPSLGDPIEPALFDPDDPQNSNNTQLLNFVDVYEIDPLGNVVAGPSSLRNAVPAFSELRVRFTEPMAAESLRPWETFKVTLVPDTQDILSDVTLDPSQTTAIIRPARLDQQAGTFEIVGWGKNTKNMQIVLTSVPKPSYLQQFMSSDEVSAFLDQGVRGITDLGGQPLAFPNSRFTSASPPIRYSSAFVSTESSMTQVPPPVVRSWGVMVHRMQGRPLTGIDPATGEPGVGFRDQTNYYRPIGDVNLQTNGYLAGSPVVFTTKIHDDFFPPPHGQFGKFPLGVPAPLATNHTALNQPHDGARFQTVWRDIDASPSRDALAGTLLDLYRVSWAPIGGNVTTDNYDNVSIHCAHSPLRPITTQNGAGSNEPLSGLGQPFDWDAWISLIDPAVTDKCSGPCSFNTGPNYWDTLVTCVAPGTKYKITQSNLFAPPFDGNAYHPWPAFAVPFQYNNGDIPQAEKDLRDSTNKTFTCSGGVAWQEKRIFNSNEDYNNLGGDSLMFEVRIRPQTTAISRQNGFTMAIGILLSSDPKFRVFSLGTPGKTIDPDNINGDKNARCAINDTKQPSDYFCGDNSRYFTVLDYVKTTSRVTSPFVRVFPVSTTDADYFPPIIFPPLSALPSGTTATFEFGGANGIAGSGAIFSTNIDTQDKKPNLAFRATLVGNTTTLLLPSFDTIAIPYLRPTGS